MSRIGRDEISTRKGHKQYHTVVCDLDSHELLDVIEGREQEQLKEALSQQPQEIREQVEEVCVDMWPGFPAVIEEMFPNANVVYDPFHVIKILNQRLNKIRRICGLRTRRMRGLMLRNCEELSPEEREELAQNLQEFPLVQIAYEFKEEFREIYQKTRTAKSRLKKIKKWLNQARVLFQEFSQTVKNHLTGICNFFDNRTTNGVMEGLNRRSRVILQRSYGLTNFENLRGRLLFEENNKSDLSP